MSIETVAFHANLAPEPRPQRPVDVFRRSVAVVRDRLPPGWAIVTEPTRSPDPPGRLLLTTPDGDAVSFGVTVSRGVLSGDVARIADEIGGNDRGFVCAHYLSEPVRRHLDERGISYADATGNLSLVAARPALWVRDRGADADPWRGPGRPAGLLTGEPADRVVRALADFDADLSVPRIVRLAGTSTGAAYRVVEVLVDRGLARRGPRGPVADVRWDAMLAAWAADRRTAATRGFAAAGGADAVREALAATVGPRYAVTGIDAAGYRRGGTLEVYADDVDEFAATLDLRPVGSDPDVLVATPWSSVVFERTDRRDGLVLAAASQIYADLLSGPFRHPDAAEHFARRLEADPSWWRRSPS